MKTGIIGLAILLLALEGSSCEKYLGGTTLGGNPSSVGERFERGCLDVPFPCLLQQGELIR